MQENGLMTKLKLFSKFISPSTGKQTIAMHILLNISRSKEKLFLLEKLWGKSKWSAPLVLIYFGSPRLKHAINLNLSILILKHTNFRLLIQRYAQFWFFGKGCETSFSTKLAVWILKKNISHVTHISVTDEISLNGYL